VRANTDVQGCRERFCHFQMICFVGAGRSRRDYLLFLKHMHLLDFEERGSNGWPIVEVAYGGACVCFSGKNS
jgi:hypothetical protein